MKRLFCVLTLLCSWAFAQTPAVAPISGQAVNQFGQPLAYAQITICSVTSTGVPCTPVANIYEDYGLAHSIPNPTSADQYGNYLVYVPAIPYPNLYVIQISAGSGLYWTYVENGPNNGGGGGSGCTPSGAEYDVLYQGASDNCLGNAGFTYNPSPGMGEPDVTISTTDSSGADIPILVTSTSGEPVEINTTDSNGTNEATSINTLATETDTIGRRALAQGGSFEALLAYNSTNVGDDSAWGVQCAGVNHANGGSAVADQIIGCNASAEDASTNGDQAQIALNAIAGGGNYSAYTSGLTTNTGAATLQGSTYGVDVASLTLNNTTISGMAASIHAAQPAESGTVSVTTGPYVLATDAGTYPNYFGNPLILGTLTPGNSPPCPNGPNGELTNSGCTGGSSYPAGTGVPEVTSGTSWGMTYNASNQIPANFVAIPITTIDSGGTPVTPSAGVVNFAAGTNVTLTPSGNTITITASNTGATAFSALTSATNTTAAMVVGSGASLGVSGSGTIAATSATTSTTATNLAGTGTDYAPYQSASATTGYITAPTTSGHTFVYAWQPSGSAVAPTALDLGTYLAAPPAIGGTTPAAGKFSALTDTACSTAGLATTTSGGVLGCEAVPTWNQNTTGSAGSLTNGPTFTSSTGTLTIANGKTFTVSNTLTLAGTDSSTLNIGTGGTLGTGAYASAYVLPTATSSVLGGVKPDGTSILNSSGAISVTPTSIGLSNVTNNAQTKAAIVPNTSPSAGQILVGNTGGTAYAPVAMSGDCTLAYTGAITCLDSNGTPFGTGAFANAPTITTIQSNTTPVTPTAGVINFAAGTNVTLTPSGDTITITASNTGATAFSALTSATNTSAAMVVGTGASLAVSGTGTIAATSATTATSFTGSLAGDVTGTQSATSVVKVNGLSLPTSKTIVGTNGAGQLVDASSATLSNNTTGSAASATNFTGSLSGDVTGTQSSTTVSKINNGTVPTSAPLLGTNSSAAPVAVTLTGILKGNGSSAVTAATAGTDYLTPTGSGAALTGITPSQVGTVTKVASGTIALPSGSAIATGTCSVVTATLAGVLSTDVVNASPNGDISGVTGYAPTGQIVQIYPPWTTSGQLNVKICNPSANTASITPGAVILNYNITR